MGVSLKFPDADFIHCIPMVVISLNFSNVTLGVWRLGTDLRRLARGICMALSWFFIAAFIAIAVGLNEAFRPGLRAHLTSSGSIPQSLSVEMDRSRFILDFIPSNVIAATASQHVLPTVLLAMLLGLALFNIV